MVFVAVCSPPKNDSTKTKTAAPYEMNYEAIMFMAAPAVFVDGILPVPKKYVRRVVNIVLASIKIASLTIFSTIFIITK